MPCGSEVLTVAQMTACDQAAIAAGTPGQVLMARAGEAVAAAIVARWPRQAVLVLCGRGNNGGDGFVAATALAQAGWPVRVALTCEVADLHGDAAAAALVWTQGGFGQVERLSVSGLEGAGLVVDALFGAGLSKPLEPILIQTLQAAERLGLPIVAIDLPSGLSGDLARRVGDYAPKANLTVTFHRKKLAHLLEPGRSLCGEVVVADIGLGPVVTALKENGPGLWLAHFPWPSARSHKHARGRMIVVSGNAWSTGAARLSARAGLRVGAGLVTVLSPPDALAINAAHLEAIMLRPFETEAELEAAAKDVDVAVIGPAAGVDEATVSNLFALSGTGAALVVDADALTVFRHDTSELFSVLDRDDVLTPHPGEFERIFPGLLRDSPERATAAREAAKRAGAIVLLKGFDTVIAAPDGRCVINANGSVWLATAGSGDVLAGLVAGLIAQGMESFDAACAAVWIHAEAATLFGPGLIAEDLPGLVPQVLRKLHGAVASAD